MSERAFFLDVSVGETRGVVTLDGRPERFFLERPGDPQALVLGARSVARVRTVEKGIGAAFLDLPGGVEAVLPLKADESPPARGTSVEIEIRTEARRDKLAVARLLEPATGEPRLIEPGLDVAGELAALARGAPVVEGAEAREAADLAQAQILATEHPLPGGGSLAIEPTRALVSIDIDLGARGGTDSKRAARQANLAAIGASARLLRLKGLGGIVVFDFVGRGHDGKAIDGAVRAAFSPDNPGVAIDRISRFGTLTLTVPRRRAPASERFLDAEGRLLPVAAAAELARSLEREGRSSPGARLTARCAPAAAEAFRSLAPAMTDRLGARFVVEVRDGWPVDRMEVTAT